MKRILTILISTLILAGCSVAPDDVLPGKKVHLEVGVIDNGYYLFLKYFKGDPLWSCTDPKVTPKPFIDEDGKEVTWKVSKVVSHKFINSSGVTPKDPGWARNESTKEPITGDHVVWIEFKLEDSDRLFGRSLAVDIEMPITTYRLQNGKLVEKEITIAKTLEFTVIAADKVTEYRLQYIRNVILLCIGIAAIPIVFFMLGLMNSNLDDEKFKNYTKVSFFIEVMCVGFVSVGAWIFNGIVLVVLFLIARGCSG